MAFQFIRKLSMRKKSHVVHEHKKCSAASSTSSLASQSSEKLTAELANLVVDQLSVFAKLRLKRISRDVHHLVDQVSRLVVSKASLTDCCPSQGWERKKDAQIAIRLIGDTVEIVVDEKWTSRDVECVVSLMALFRENVVTAQIDAPIAELLIVSLSDLDLQQWYAFQCFMKAHNVFDAVEDDSQHLMVASGSQSGDVYWPNLEELTVRTSREQSPHLARVIDYGVLANNVLNRKKLSNIRIVYTDVEENVKALARHIFHFRCWAGSAGFDHRFEQQFTSKPVIY